MQPPPQYPVDSVQQVSLMPYPSSLPAVPSVGSPVHGYLDYYNTAAAVAASQPAHSGAAVYLQPVAQSPAADYPAGVTSTYTGYPCVQYSPMVLSPTVYSVQAPPAAVRPALVGPGPAAAYTVPPPPVVVQQEPGPPTAGPSTPAAVQLVPLQGQVLCNVARLQPPPQVAARPVVAGMSGLLYK